MCSKRLTQRSVDQRSSLQWVRRSFWDPKDYGYLAGTVLFAHDDGGYPDNAQKMLHLPASQEFLSGRPLHTTVSAKQTLGISCKKTKDAVSVAELYFSNIVKDTWGSKDYSLKQGYGKTEVTNKTLGRILRCIVRKSLKDWDLKLPQAEFSFNRAPSSASGHSPFEVVYGINPLMPLDLSSVPKEEINYDSKKRVEKMLKLHETVKRQIEKANDKY
ncbi:uncharacterized protein LOC141607723 [Silene latifolia]|uniref:uncharacterized protein LOC141607723 n=1 Tax=Silene latifolia TaxID=37657 RepID=UPI003D7824DF